MEEDNPQDMFTTSIECNDMDMDRFDSGICLSTPSLCSDLEATMKNMSLLKVREEDELNVSEVLADVPTEALFYQNHDGDTLLHLALICNNADYATYLVHKATNHKFLNIQNYTFHQTPLHISVMMKNILITKMLLEVGASKDLKDKHGDTPLHVACSMGDFTFVQEILSDNNNSSFVKSLIEGMNYEGRTCLHLALDSKSFDKLKIVEFLVCKHGADISVREGKRGHTILHELVLNGDFSGLTFLCNLHIPAHFPRFDVNAPSYDGSTPLDISLQMSLPQIADVLLCRGGVTSAPPSYLSESSSD